MGLPVSRSRFSGESGQPLPARLLANRGLWKSAIYVVAFLTYVSSFLFFGLALAEFQSADNAAAVMDLLIAIYFLIQVIFLFILSWFVERRRQQMPISFPNRRHD